MFAGSIPSGLTHVGIQNLDQKAKKAGLCNLQTIDIRNFRDTLNNKRKR